MAAWGGAVLGTKPTSSSGNSHVDSGLRGLVGGQFKISNELLVPKERKALYEVYFSFIWKPCNRAVVLALFVFYLEVRACKLLRVCQEVDNKWTW